MHIMLQNKAKERATKRRESHHAKRVMKRKAVWRHLLSAASKAGSAKLSSLKKFESSLPARLQRKFLDRLRRRNAERFAQHRHQLKKRATRRLAAHERRLKKHKELAAKSKARAKAKRARRAVREKRHKKYAARIAALRKHARSAEKADAKKRELATKKRKSRVKQTLKKLYRKRQHDVA